MTLDISNIKAKAFAIIILQFLFCFSVVTKADNSQPVLSVSQLDAQYEKDEAIMGGVHGGGGDDQCIRYIDTSAFLMNELLKMGQDKLTKDLPDISISLVRSYQKKLKCIPMDKLDRVARTSQKTNRTYLFLERYKGLSDQQILRFNIHELLILSEYEHDGEYYYSDELLKLLKRHSINIRLKYLEGNRAEKVIENEDGSVLLTYPFYNENGVKYYLTIFDTDKVSNQLTQSVCGYFGLFSNQKSQVRKLIFRDFSEFSASDVANFDKKLTYLSHLNWTTSQIEVTWKNQTRDSQYIYIIQSVTCSKEP